MASIYFSKKFPSELYIVKRILPEILDFIVSHLPKLSSEDYFDLKLVFSELLLNAVLHGNRQDQRKSVSVYVEILPSNIIFSTIADEGVGFNYLPFCSSEKKENLLHEGGRGIQLVFALTDHISFNRSGSQINFYKKVNA